MRHVLGRMGRRGLILTLFGFLWVCMGVYIWLDTRPYNPADAIFYESWPTWLRVVLWTVTGFVAAVAAFQSRHPFWFPTFQSRRYEVTWQDLGFMALTVMPTQRAVGGGMSAWDYIVPGEPPGAARSIITGVLWATIGAVILIISGWDEDYPESEDA